MTSFVHMELMSIVGSVEKKVICKSGIDGSFFGFSLLLFLDRVQDIAQGWAEKALACQSKLFNIWLFNKDSLTFWVPGLIKLVSILFF